MSAALCWDRGLLETPVTGCSSCSPPFQPGLPSRWSLIIILAPASHQTRCSLSSRYAEASKIAEQLADTHWCCHADILAIAATVEGSEDNLEDRQAVDARSRSTSGGAQLIHSSSTLRRRGARSLSMEQDSPGAGGWIRAQVCLVLLCQDFSSGTSIHFSDI